MVKISSDFKLMLKIRKKIFALGKSLNGVQELINVNKNGNDPCYNIR